MSEMNDLLGFKPIDSYVGKVQGISEDYVGMGEMVGKVLDYRKVNVEIGDHVYEGFIAHLDTGLGKIPALFPIKYVNEIKYGVYLYFKAEIKANFAYE